MPHFQTMRLPFVVLSLLSSVWGRQETSESKSHRGLVRRIDRAEGINDMVCMDGQRALVPNESQVRNFTIVNGAVPDAWGDLDLPSVLEINRFNSNTYFSNLALGNLAEADANYANSNMFFYSPMAENGDFRPATREPLLAISYANWDCLRQDFAILVHAVPGRRLNADSPLNTITVGGVAFDPTPGDFIRDSDNNPVGFQIVIPMAGCDFCESIVIQASVGGLLATTGQFPELDVALQCCPDPSEQPSSSPSRLPTKTPSRSPSALPSSDPSSNPTDKPSRSPSALPSSDPSSNPTDKPSKRPSFRPSSFPSALPSSSPSLDPTVSSAPSKIPSVSPTDRPSVLPSVLPSISVAPSSGPSTSVAPSVGPTDPPSKHPSALPTKRPSVSPSSFPSISFAPSKHPTLSPTASPSLKPQVCFPFRHPKFFPYRVEVWSGETISRSDNNVCSPEKDFMYPNPNDPYKYYPFKPEPSYPFLRSGY